MGRCGFCLLALLSVSAPAWSQAADAHPVPRSPFSLYAGYALLAPNIFGNPSESGWNTGIDIGITRSVAAAVDFSQYFFDYGVRDANTTPLFVMAGPRVCAPVGNAGKLRLFADFLAGGGFIQTGRSRNYPAIPANPGLFAGSTSSAWNAGGGVDIRAANHLWVRGQAGYMHTDFTTWDSEVQRSAPPGHARITIGILYRR